MKNIKIYLVWPLLLTPYAMVYCQNNRDSLEKTELKNIFKLSDIIDNAFEDVKLDELSNTKIGKDVRSILKGKQITSEVNKQLIQDKFLETIIRKTNTNFLKRGPDVTLINIRSIPGNGYYFNGNIAEKKLNLGFNKMVGAHWALNAGIRANQNTNDEAFTLIKNAKGASDFGGIIGGSYKWESKYNPLSTELQNRFESEMECEMKLLRSEYMRKIEVLGGQCNSTKENLTDVYFKEVELLYTSLMQKYIDISGQCIVHKRLNGSFYLPFSKKEYEVTSIPVTALSNMEFYYWDVSLTYEYWRICPRYLLYFAPNLTLLNNNNIETGILDPITQFDYYRISGDPIQGNTSQYNSKDGYLGGFEKFFTMKYGIQTAMLRTIQNNETVIQKYGIDLKWNAYTNINSGNVVDRHAVTIGLPLVLRGREDQPIEVELQYLVSDLRTAYFKSPTYRKKNTLFSVAIGFPFAFKE